MQEEIIKDSSVLERDVKAGEKYYLIKNPRFDDIYLAFDGVTLLFSTEDYAEKFATSTYAKGEYEIVEKEVEEDNTTFLGDNCIVRREETKNEDGSILCEDILVRTHPNK